MKILNVVYSLGKGGTERAAQNFAFGYADLGHDSRVVFTRVDGVRRQYICAKNIPLYHLQKDSDCLEIANWSPAVVHLHSHGVSVEEFNKIKLVAPSARYVETNVFSKPSPWVEEIDISYQLSQWCQWLYWKRSPKKYPSVVVPCPVETSSFQFAGEQKRNDFRDSHGLKADDIVIGRVGQHYNEKWSILLLELFDKLKKTDERLKLLVVNPPEIITKRLAKSPYQSDIVHIDKIHGDEQLSACYSSIDIFILIAEQGESFGMVLAESLLCTTPIVALSTPWGDNSQGEVVGNGIGGLVAANKKDVEPLVKRLIDDPELRKKFGKAGRERIVELYDSKKIARRSLAIIDTVSTVDHSPPGPLILMKNTEGRLGFFTKIILKAERLFGLLRFSTGYRPIIDLPRAVLHRTLVRIERFIQTTDMFGKKGR